MKADVYCPQKIKDVPPERGESWNGESKFLLMRMIFHNCDLFGFFSGEDIPNSHSTWMADLVGKLQGLDFLCIILGSKLMQSVSCGFWGVYILLPKSCVLREWLSLVLFKQVCGYLTLDSYQLFIGLHSDHSNRPLRWGTSSANSSRKFHLEDGAPQTWIRS